LSWFASVGLYSISISKTPHSHWETIVCFLAVPISSVPLSTLPLTSLLPFLSSSLISSIKALLSGLCQGGMLTTPGIVTLREFTPLKVFITSSSFPPSLSLFLSLLCVYLYYISVSPASFTSFVLLHPLFFSQLHNFTHTHIEKVLDKCSSVELQPFHACTCSHSHYTPL